MTAYREKLVERMIQVYGLEHTIVIQFAEVCENWPNTRFNDTTLRLLVEGHEMDPVLD